MTGATLLPDTVIASIIATRPRRPPPQPHSSEQNASVERSTCVRRRLEEWEVGSWERTERRRPCARERTRPKNALASQHEHLGPACCDPEHTYKRDSDEAKLPRSGTASLPTVRYLRGVGSPRSAGAGNDVMPRKALSRRALADCPRSASPFALTLTVSMHHTKCRTSSPGRGRAVLHRTHVPRVARRIRIDVFVADEACFLCG